MRPRVPADPPALAELLEERRVARQTLVLGDDDVRELLDERDCLALQREALIAHSAGTTEAPGRLLLGPTAAGVRVGAMPGHATGHRALASKLLTSAAGNRDLDLPRSMSTLVLFDPDSGFPLAVMGSTYLTNLRTAATAALALTVLGARGANTLGVYGSGPVARLAVRILLGSAPALRTVVYSPTPENRAAFADAFQKGGAPVRSTDDPTEPAGADLVLAASDGRGPVFAAADLSTGATVASVASRAERTEIPLEAFTDGRAVVDDRTAALREAGEFSLRGASAPIHAELGEILAGRCRSRGSEEERWIFKSTGLAVQDAITARSVFVRALDRGAGISRRLVS